MDKDFNFYLGPADDECLLIKNFENLKIWKPEDCKRYTTYPLQKRALVINSPKTLVLYDVVYEYLGDRLLHGSGDVNNFYFIHWSMIDIFVYYSQDHLVSIPPCNWITSAHRNGVKILGTFKTETECYEEDSEMCKYILSDIPSVHNACMQLVNIANFYQFDGWLIDIEKELTQEEAPRSCFLLEEFVRFLTLKMHEIQPESLVIWYDTIIDSQQYQAELNKYNKNFFNVCDGILLNYMWEREELQKSVQEAGCRKTDVFAGVDVSDGVINEQGGFSSDSVCAVSTARSYNLSVAISGLTWDFKARRKHFKEKQYRFWGSLSELYAPRVIESLPYYTSFCPGFGNHLYQRGQIVCFNKPWFNMGLQQPQPSFHYKNCLDKGSTITFSCEDSFNGGGCLHISHVVKEHKSVEFGILATNFHLNSSCSITYTFKPLCYNIKVVLVLSMQTIDGVPYVLNLVDQCDEGSEKPFTCFCCGVPKTKNISPLSTKKIDESERMPWIRRKYKLYCHKDESCLVTKVSIHIAWKESLSEISALLGELLISLAPEEIIFSYKDLFVEEDDDADFHVQCLLEWKSQICIDFFDLYFIVNGSMNHICRTSQYNYQFFVAMHKVPVIEFVLSPNYSGKSLQSVLLKMPIPEELYLESD